MHASKTDFVFWILNPVLRAMILFLLRGWKHALGISIFRGYQIFYLAADALMFAFFWFGWPSAYLYGAWTASTIVFLFQMAIAIQLMRQTNGWRKRSWTTWAIVTLGTTVMLRWMGTPTWTAYSSALQWCDIACWVFVLSSIATDHIKWYWPHKSLAVGLLATLSTGVVARMFTPTAPGPIARMGLQATLTLGLLVWIWYFLPSNRPQKSV